MMWGHRLAGWGAAVAWLLVAAPVASAQVGIGPTTLVVSDREPFGTMLVSNRSQEAQEVVVSSRFGFPVSDAEGDIRIEWEAAQASERYGVDDWVQIFPRQFVLEPGEQQTVRLAVRAPADAADGVYWTRLITTSSPVARPPSEVADGVQARVVFRLQQITTLLMRVGAVGTGVVVGEVEADADAETLTVRVPLERTGNAPYLGTATLVLRDAEGAEAARASGSVAVYFDLVRRLELSRDGLPPGDYTLELTLVSERGDIPPRQWVRSDPVTTTLRVTLP